MGNRERFRIVPFTNPSGQLVHRVQGRLPEGRQVRENFTDFIHAVRRKAELELQSVGGGPLTETQTLLNQEQLTQASTAFQKLGNRTSLLEAVDFFLKHSRDPIKPITIEEACQQFLQSKQVTKRLRARTLSDYTCRLNLLRKRHGKKQPTELILSQIEDLIFTEGQHPQTAIRKRSVLYNFFGWCLKRNYVTHNPIERIENPEKESREPKILNLPQVAALLKAACGFKEGRLIPYLAIALFAGLRPNELARIQWQHIELDKKLIILTGEVTKLRQRRIVELPDNLIEWINPHKGNPVFGPNWRKRFDQVRRLAGFQGSSIRDGDESLTPWPPDGLRHTALSYKYALTKSDTETAAWAGNSADVLHRHYRGLVTPEEAATYWNLRPDNLEIKIPK